MLHANVILSLLVSVANVATDCGCVYAESRQTASAIRPFFYCFLSLRAIMCRRQKKALVFAAMRYRRHVSYLQAHNEVLAMPSLSRRSFIFMALAVAACKRGAADILLSGQTMGTSYSIVGVNSPGIAEAELKDAINETLLDVDIKMSNWNSASEVSTINAHSLKTPLPLSRDMTSLLEAAHHVHAASEGQFDITLGPLIDLWGFGAARPPGIIPADAEITAAMRSVGQKEMLQVKDGQLYKGHPDAAMYLSAIGKGFGVDRLGDTLAQFGLTNYMVEIGGDIVTSGTNAQGQPWQIAIETPDALARSIHQVVGVADLGMATSGDYRNYFEKDGVRYSHIIDRNTGRPVTHATASVTVLAENAMLADAWATALLALGQERGLDVAEKHKIASLFIERSAKTDHVTFNATPSTEFDAIIAG
ncbi:FAD:protein FMN transferase [Shimia sp. R9_3]|uniref:FAD:protein FMN transferase n=1 Tax=Shimia sp. R9_3 TaxID=2821113 RepID=UPI001FFE2A1E|nr:FAD:protein FMN transferase [Shimia sp. R9_3]